MVKTQKRVFLLILTLTVLFIVGCRTANVDQPREVNYRTGTRGLELSFPTNAPTKVFEGDSDVRFIVEIRNRGAFPQSDEIGDFDGKLWIGGFDEQILTIFPRLGSSISLGINLEPEELEGKSSFNRDGGFSVVEFQMDVNDLPQGLPFYKPTIIVTATYLYKTIANPVICIDPEPRSTRVREKVCTTDRSFSVGSQGAPITITSVEQDVTSNDFLFNIFIDNVGGGLVIRESDIDNNPNEGFDWRDLDEVRIEDVRVGNIRMTECRPRIGRDVHLIDGKGIIFCRLDKSVAEGKAFETTLNVQLAYGYTTSIEEQIEVFEEISFR